MTVLIETTGAPWSATMRTTATGDVAIGGVPLTEIADRFDTPAYVTGRRRGTRGAAAPTGPPSPTPTSLYAAKAFLSRAMVQLGRRRKGWAWTSARPGSWSSPSPPVSRPSASCCTATPNRPATWRRRCASASAGSSSTAPRRDRQARRRRRPRRAPEGLVRVVAGHLGRRPRQDPHRYATTRSSASPSPTEPRSTPSSGSWASRGSNWSACTATSARRSPTSSLPGGPAADGGPDGAHPRHARHRACPSSTWAAATASPTGRASPSSTSPRSPARLRTELAGGLRRGTDSPVPRLIIEPGPGHRRPGGDRALPGPRRQAHRRADVRRRRRRDERQPAARAVRGALRAPPGRPRLHGRAAHGHRRRPALRGGRRPRRRRRAAGDIRPGDLLAVPVAGAYQLSMASGYNLVGRPPVVAVHNNRARLLVRREVDEDLMRRDVGL